MEFKAITTELVDMATKFAEPFDLIISQFEIFLIYNLNYAYYSAYPQNCFE